MSVFVASAADAAYPNGGIFTFSTGTRGITPTTRTIRGELVKPGGHIFATHYFNYGADKLLGQARPVEEGVLFPQALATRFMGADQGFVMWAANNATFNADVGFNVVYFRPNTPNVFTVTADANNRLANYVLIDHPQANGNPNANVYVQQLYMYGAAASAVPRNIGVWYHAAVQKWAIFHQTTSAPMQAGEQYDVFVAPVVADGTAVSRVIAGPSNTRGNAVRFQTIGRRLIVTQNWAPRGVYNDHPIGVRRTRAEGFAVQGVSLEWEIFNEDGAAMAPGTAFNVLVDPDDALH